MMQLFIVLMASVLSFAETTGMTTESEKKKELTPQEFISRFQVNGEMFVMSADGKRLLYRISESSTGAPSAGNPYVVSNWGHEHNLGDKVIKICLRNEFQIEKDGSVKVHLQQFDSMNPNRLKGTVQYGKLIKEDKMDLKDFAPISWPVYSDANVRIVARFTPVLVDLGQTYAPGENPIYLENAVLLDGTGKVWADGVSEGGGKYISVSTHKGTLAMSFFPFPGAKEIGVARQNEMILSGVSPSLTLRSAKPFLSANGELKVYGMVQPERKTERLHSVHLIVTDKEPEFHSSLNN